MLCRLLCVIQYLNEDITDLFFLCVCACVSQQFMWAGCIIKINDKARPLPKQGYTQTHCNRLVKALKVVFQQKDHFLFIPLALFVSLSLFFLSLPISLSFFQHKMPNCSISHSFPSSPAHPLIWLLTPNTLNQQ